MSTLNDALVDAVDALLDFWYLKSSAFLCISNAVSGITLVLFLQLGNLTRQIPHLTMYTFLFISALIGAAIYLLLNYFDKKSRTRIALRGLKYVSFRNPILSMILKERTEVTTYELIKKEGKTFGIDMLQTPTIVSADPEIAQLVLSKEFTNFTNRRIIKFDDPVFGAVLSNAMDDQWKRMRSVVTPTFSAGSLRKMKPRIDETVQTLVNNFEVARLQSPEVDVKKLYGSYTMDTIIQVAFGTIVDSLNDPTNPVIAHALKVFSKDMDLKTFATLMIMLLMPKVGKFFGFRIMKDTLEFFEKFSQDIIKRKKEELKRNKGSLGKANSFLELVLEAEAEFEATGGRGEMASSNGTSPNEEGFKKAVKFMTTEEMVAQCVLFFLAGYDTTATTITLACYLLALNPEAQEKLVQESNAILAKLSSEPGNEGKNPIELVTYDNLHRFEYLNGVISETLRLYAPASMTERSAGGDIVLQTDDGSTRIEVKKGDVVHFPIYSMHRDPENFPEPEEFRPERFIGEPTFHKYSYLPFGQGPRNCVARSLALLEAKMALLHTVRVYKFSRGEKTKVPFEQYYQNNLISPKDIVLKVEKRN